MKGSRHILNGDNVVVHDDSKAHVFWSLERVENTLQMEKWGAIVRNRGRWSKTTIHQLVQWLYPIEFNDQLTTGENPASGATRLRTSEAETNQSSEASGPPLGRSRRIAALEAQYWNFAQTVWLHVLLYSYSQRLLPFSSLNVASLYYKIIFLLYSFPTLSVVSCIHFID